MGTWTEVNPVTIGNPTKKSDYDALWDNISWVQQVRIETGAATANAAVIPWDDTIPNSTEGTEYFSLAITPKNSSNVLLIEADLFLSPATVDHVSAALLQDTATAAIAVACEAIGAAFINDVRLRHYMTAGSTAATTFKVRAGGAAHTVTLNGSGGARKFGGLLMSSLTITELKP